MKFVACFELSFVLIGYCSLFKESGKKEAACQKLNCQDVWKTAKSENRGESSSQSLSSKKYLKIASCLHRKPDVKTVMFKLSRHRNSRKQR